MITNGIKTNLVLNEKRRSEAYAKLDKMSDRERQSIINQYGTLTSWLSVKSYDRVKVE